MKTKLESGFNEAAPVAGHAAKPHTRPRMLTSRIKLEHAQAGPVWRWMVTVDNRAPEPFISHGDAITFARGVDIGQACNNAPTLLRERDQLRTKLKELAKAIQAVCEPMFTASDGGAIWCSMRERPGATKAVDRLEDALASVQPEDEPQPVNPHGK